MAQLTDSRIMSLREVDTGAPWLVTGHRLSRDRLDEVLAVAATAAAVLGWEMPPGPEQLGARRLADGGFRRLVIAEGTVKSHVKHILRKLDAANRAEAVSRWLRSGGAGVARAGYPPSRDGPTWSISSF